MTAHATRPPHRPRVRVTIPPAEPDGQPSVIHGRLTAWQERERGQWFGLIEWSRPLPDGWFADLMAVPAGWVGLCDGEDPDGVERRWHASRRRARQYGRR